MKKPFLAGNTLQKIAWVVIGSMVLIQVVAYLLNQLFGVGGNVRLGTGFMLLIILGIVMVAFTLIMRQQREDAHMSKVNIAIMLLAVGILIFLLLNIKAWVPDIFSQAVFDLKSMIGII